MMGSKPQKGLVYRTAKCLLAEAAKDKCKVVMSYFQIYNEQVQDVLQYDCVTLEVSECP